MCYTQYELSNKNDAKSNTTLVVNHNNEIDYKSK